MMVTEDMEDLKDMENIEAVVAQAAAAFADGQLVIFPTETVYGIGASGLSDSGVQRLRTLKGRPDGVQPFTIHLPDAASASRYVDVSHPYLRRLVDKVFPGPVTLVVDVSDAVMADSLDRLGLTMDQADRLYHEKTVGLRCPAHALGRAVLGAVDGPVLASSANLRGGDPPRDFAEANSAVGAEAGLGVDGGKCGVSKPSTILRITIDQSGSPALSVLREGVYDLRYIEKLMQRKILFVCSGNTCRSPMAAGLARSMWPNDVVVQSAGTFTRGGGAASEHAVTAAAELGVDLSGHRSAGLDMGMIHEADVIYGMTQRHVDAVLAMAPDAANKTELLDMNGRDVDDPYGGDLATYQACARQLQALLSVRLVEHEEARS